MVQREQDEKFAGTYRKLFDTIERGLEQCSTDRLQTLLEEKKDQLKLGLEAFAKPSSAARSKITTGASVTVDGKSISLKQTEKDLVLRLSDILDLNELNCVQLWEAYRQENKQCQGDDMADNVELIMKVSSFYYEDRISLLQCISSLQRISLDETHPYYAIANDSISKLFDNNLADRLFTQFKQLVRSAIPRRSNLFPGYAIVWAKQNVKEQKSLLEIIFLSSLTHPFKPEFILAVIQEFEANCFGVLQVFSYALDEEGDRIHQSVVGVCTLLAISMIVPPTLSIDSKISSTAGELFDSPDVIVKINEIALHMGDRKQHAPFLLAWSFFLTCIDSALYSDENSTVPTHYQAVECILQGKGSETTSALISRPHIGGSDFDETRQIQIEQGEHMNRRYLGRALKLSVFDVGIDILNSEICNEEDVNNFGYRSVFRSLLKGFLSTTRPYYIPLDSYTSLIQCYCLVYKNQGTIGESFWEEDFDAQDPNTLLATACHRFPVYFQDFTSLLSALCGDKTNGKCAEKVFEYLCHVPTITADITNNLNVVEDMEAGPGVYRADQTLRITQEIGSIASVEVPEGSRGTLLSQTENEKVIQFAHGHSGWHMLISVLAGFKENGSGIDVKDEEDVLKGNNMTAVDSILDLIHHVLSNNPKLITTLVQHVESVARIPGQSSDVPVLISVLCKILSACSTVLPRPIPTMTLSLKCLVLLLPHYRSNIWLYLQSAPLLPRSGTVYASSLRQSNPAAQIETIVAQVECVTGKYSLLLAFLDLVQGLVRDAQRSWWVDDKTNSTFNPSRDQQVQVLYHCVHYLMLDVFPSYATWRYESLSERYLVGSKVVDTFIDITRGFKEKTPIQPQQQPPQQQQQPVTLNSIRHAIFTNFLYEGGLYHIDPLLNAITDGCDRADVLYKLNYPKEAQRIEHLTERTFIFIKVLLQYHLEQTHAGSVRESALEHYLLERVTQDNCSDFLYRIARHINYRHNIALQIQSTHVLYLLSRTTSNWKVMPNFVQYLGSTDQVHQLIRTYLEIAKDPFQHEQLLSAIWKWITHLLETQPSLAVLFLDCGDLIMPSPKSAVRLLAGEKTKPLAAAPPPVQAESAIRAAIDILGDYESLSMQKPTVLSNVMRFLSTFWQTAFDHYTLVERHRSDNALWDGLGKVLLNQGNDMDTSGSHLQLVDLLEPSANASRHDTAVRRLCCLNLSKAYAMRVMALEIHLTASNERAQGNTNTTVDRLPAGLKNLMNKVSDASKLTQLCQTFVKNDFDASAAKKALRDAEIVLESVGNYNDPSILLYKNDRMGGYGDDDAAGEPRQYGDSYLYDYQLAEQRVSTLFKDIISRYGFTDLENVIVTPEVQAALDMKRYANNLLKSVLTVNYNSSMVDSQIILFRSFKSLVEIASQRASDLMWANKTKSQGAASLFAFLKGLIQHAQEEERDDGVSLTSYDILIKFIRGLTEDWIDKNASVLTGTDAALKKAYASQSYELLSALCGLLSRENFAVLNSINDCTAIRFHRALLESIMLSLHTLGGVVSELSGMQTEFQACLAVLLDVVCKSFQALVAKASSNSIEGIAITEEATESCIKDITVVVSLLQDLISPKYNVPDAIWVDCFTANSTIHSLLNLFYGGVEIAVKEIISQTPANGGVFTLSITPYAESALYFLLELSNIPRGADELVRRNIFGSFSNNGLTSKLQKGELDMFIHFGDTSKTGPAFVERNPLHIIWCQMLAVVGNLNRQLGSLEGVFEKTINLMQMYGPQIGAAFNRTTSKTQSVFGLPPSVSLSTPLLEELERINQVFFGLANHFRKNKVSNPNIDNLFIAFKDCALDSLQHYLYFYTHPTHMQAQLYPIDNVERQQAQLNTQDAKASRFMQKVLGSSLTISHIMMTTLIILTEANVILTEQDIKWPFGNTIFTPDMRMNLEKSSSFGTLAECVHASVAMLQENKKLHTKEILDFLNDSLLLLATQTALWIAKPDITDEQRNEIAVENLGDIVDTISKVEASIKKLEINGHETRIKLIQTIQVFFYDRYFKR